MALSFETLRLNVTELQDDFSSPECASLIDRIPEILTQSVVENLPPYFHGIDSAELACGWLERMLSESQLWLVRLKDQTLIGFLFVHLENSNEAHIGYLLAEEYWGKGLASEMLQAFVGYALKEKLWVKITGGVDRSNTASINLLRKLGFIERASSGGSVLNYEYTISGEQS